MLDQISRIRPVLTHLAVFLVTLIFALWMGTTLVSIDNVGLWQLDTSYQGIYVQSVADAYALDGDRTLAADRLSYLCQEDGDLVAAFADAEQRYGQAPAKLENLNALQNDLVATNGVTQNPGVDVCSTRPVIGVVGRILPVLGLLLIGAGIVGYGVYLIINANEEDEAPVRATAGRTVTPGGTATSQVGGSRGAPPSSSAAAGSAPAKEERQQSTRPTGLAGLGLGRGGRSQAAEAPAEPKTAAARGAQISAEAEKTDFTAQGQRPPVVQFMTTYLHGDDLYDDSFSIETPSGEFLGETGVGISETLTGGDGNKDVTAFEVWLFDKNDIRTVTRVIMSDHAFNDPAIRDKLRAKGDAVLAEPGKKVVLETASMRVQARIVDMSYGSGPMPPNSRFDRITIELAAWKKEEA